MIPLSNVGTIPYNVRRWFRWVSKFSPFLWGLYEWLGSAQKWGGLKIFWVKGWKKDARNWFGSPLPLTSDTKCWFTAQFLVLCRSLFPDRLSSPLPTTPPTLDLKQQRYRLVTPTTATAKYAITAHLLIYNKQPWRLSVSLSIYNGIDTSRWTIRYLVLE